MIKPWKERGVTIGRDEEFNAMQAEIDELRAKLAEANQLEIHRCDHIGILKNNCDEMELELATIKAKLAALEQTHDQRFVELTRLRQHVTGLELQEPYELEWPDYHPEGMGCGLEDRNITNRYEAMQYGWEQALEHVAELLPERLFLAAGAAPTAKVPECLWSLDDDESGTWRSSCGELWSFIDGGPAENRVEFCHHCGGKVVLGAEGVRHEIRSHALRI